MSKKTTKLVKATQNKQQLTHITQQAANAAFTKAHAKNDSGANNYVQKFLTIVEATQSMQRSFTINELVNNSRCFDIPVSELRQLFADWCEHMQRFGKIEICNGVYDDPVIICI